MSIPVISPIEISLGAPPPKMLPAPDAHGIVDADYTVHDLEPEPTVLPPAPLESSAPISAELRAREAMSEIEAAALANRQHDPDWWRARLETVRQQLKGED